MTDFIPSNQYWQKEYSTYLALHSYNIVELAMDSIPGLLFADQFWPVSADMLLCDVVQQKLSSGLAMDNLYGQLEFITMLFLL